MKSTVRTASLKAIRDFEKPERLPGSAAPDYAERKSHHQLNLDQSQTGAIQTLQRR